MSVSRSSGRCASELLLLGADGGNFMKRVSVQIAGMTASNFFKPSLGREVDAQIASSKAGKVQRCYDKSAHWVWYYYGTK